MASTYSALKIELLETGANAGTWGTATNVNLGDAILGEAITGQATVDFATDADVTITLTDSSTSQAARNLRLNITESSSGVGSVRNLILGSGCQIEKFYLINNTGTGAKTIKNTSGTGISVPAGKATLVYNNGTNVVDAASYFTSLTLGSALPVASGGTGTATPALVQGANVTITGTWPNQTIAAASPGTGTVTSVSGTGTVNGISLSGSVTTSGSLTLGGTLSGVNLTSQVTGTLPVANGGTGATTLTSNNVILGNGTSAPLFVAPSTSGNVLTSNGSTWQSTAPAGAPNLQEFTGSGTYTKPAGATFVMVECFGAGGGGGSGRRSSGNRSGGGAGGGGSYAYRLFKASDLASTVTVTIGSGGTAGAAQTVDNTNGITGVSGGDTTFGSHLSAFGGQFGNGGTDSATFGGLGAGVLDTSGAPLSRTGANAAIYGQFGGGNVSAAAETGNPSGFGGGSGGGGFAFSAGLPGGCSYQGGAGGGGGGGLQSGTSYTGGAGGSALGPTGGGGTAGTSSGGAGGAGAFRQGGGGGGAGVASPAAAAGAGGAGGSGGGGGGGGGASNAGANSGAGGAGGNGLCRVYSW